MQITIDSNIAQVKAAMQVMASQVPYAMAVAMTTTAKQVQSEIQTAMPGAFDRPTPWVINSLRVKTATKSDPTAFVGFKDKGTLDASDARSMVEPNVNTGTRHFKGFEVQLWKLGFLPSGWNAVPGQGASIDAYGNMSGAQINQIMTALTSYVAAGRGKKTKGTGDGNRYVSEYWVNRIDHPDNPHVPRGVYQHVITGFGMGIRPVLIFVKRAQYKQHLDFFGMGQKIIDRDFAKNFDAAFEDAVATALPKS